MGLQVGGMVELPELRLVKKVKSMQVFRRPVPSCAQGDRAGICVTQLNASNLERTLLCAPGTVPTFSAAIAAVEKVRFFLGTLPSKSKVRSPMPGRSRANDHKSSDLVGWEEVCDCNWWMDRLRPARGL